MSDRLAVMRDGRIEDIGPPERVYDNPATGFVADFLGTSNLLNGHVTERQAGYAIVKLDDDTLLKVPDDRVPGGSADGTTMVRVGVRPEKLRLLPAGQEVDRSLNVVRGTITLTTYLGAAASTKSHGTGQPMIAYVQSLDALRLPATATPFSWRGAQNTRSP